MWLVIHEKCLTNDNLQRRGWPNLGCCSLCNHPGESCKHLFVDCPFSTEVWARFRTWSGIQFPIPSAAMSSSQDWWLTTRKLISKPLRRDFDTVTILVHWCIWKERNVRIFEGRCRPTTDVLWSIKEEIFSWKAAGCVSTF